MGALKNTNDFSVIGYDKDNDVSLCYGKFEELNIAIDTAKKLSLLVETDDLKRICSDRTEEPLDWIEVYANWNEEGEQLMWASYSK